MTLEEHTQEEFQRLVENESDLIEAATGIEEAEIRANLLDVLVLMAVCDGKLIAEEKMFLRKISGHLEVPLDMGKVEKRTQDYRVTARQSMAERVSSVRDTATVAGGKARSTLGKVFRRESTYESNPNVDP